MTDNVLQFPEQEELREKAKKGNSVIIEMIQKNRAAGLGKVDSALRQMDNASGVVSEPAVEARLRTLETGVRGLATVIDALNNLCDILSRDVISLLMNLDQTTAAGTLYGMHLQTIIDTLKEKGLVTDEDLKKEWERIYSEMKASKGSVVHK